MKRPLLVSFNAAKVRILFEPPNIFQSFFRGYCDIPYLYGYENCFALKFA